MDFIEAKVSTTSDAVEIVSGVFYENGLTGLMIDDEKDFEEFLENPNRTWDYIEDGLKEEKTGHGTTITFFVTDNAYGMEQLNAIKSALKNLKETEKEFDLGSLEVEVKNVKEEDWANNWKKYFKPMPIGSRIMIKPSWEELKEPTDRVVLNIDPGHIFGTGTHETTQLCLEEIESFVKEGDRVLDIGCGSGILSIGSLLLGAAHADAIDIDPNAVEIAYKNAEMNGIGKDRYTVMAGNVLESEEIFNRFAGQNYDIVEANIVADVIIALSQNVPKFIKTGGIFIASGIITDRLEDVYMAMTRGGFEIMDVKINKDWAAIAAVYTGQYLLRV